MASPPDRPGFIPPHGNYRELLSYQKAEVMYDLTFRFCQRFIAKGDRTADHSSYGGNVPGKPCLPRNREFCDNYSKQVIFLPNFAY
jgi:hypothetical protein